MIKSAGMAVFGWQHSNATSSILDLVLDNNFFPGSFPTGTYIGTITVSTSGSLFTGTFGLSGTDAASFQIVSSVLRTLGTVVNGTYHINIIPMQSGFSGSGSLFAQTLVAGNVLLDSGGVPVRTSNNGYVPVF